MSINIFFCNKKEHVTSLLKFYIIINYFFSGVQKEMMNTIFECIAFDNECLIRHATSHPGLCTSTPKNLLKIWIFSWRDQTARNRNHSPNSHFQRSKFQQKHQNYIFHRLKKILYTKFYYQNMKDMEFKRGSHTVMEDVYIHLDNNSRFKGRNEKKI